MTGSGDPYSRVDYRRLIAWPRRIEREWPFLEALLAGAPGRRVLDLGCGTGEHSRFLAAQGFEVVGLDVSEAMIERATEEPLPENLRFVRGDLVDVAELTEGGFAAALSLGNSLPHVADPERLGRAFRGLRRRLLPGAPFCFQVLNYDRVFTAGLQSLPLSFRPGEGEEIVFLRLMEPRGDGSVLFNPVTLRWRPGEEPPVEVVSARNVLLRGWRRRELEDLLDGAGFGRRELFGGMERQPYDPAASPDLVVVAR